MNKSDIRRHFRKLRESLAPDQVAAASAALCRQLAGWDKLHKARTVLAYIAFRNELELAALTDLAPDIHWLVPRVQGTRLVCHPYDPDRLVRHRFGMLEPAPDLPVIAPSGIDLVLAPGVAFDQYGGRLGFGGGFYDRFLPTTPALRVGITYDDCLVKKLPVDAHDQCVNWVVTPTLVYNCTKETVSPSSL